MADAVWITLDPQASQYSIFTIGPWMAPLKGLRWIGRSREDVRQVPDEARRNIGYALHFAQAGTKHPSAKPLQGLGAGVLEIVEDHEGSTYRAVYTVRFTEAVYVLHVFKK